MCKFRSASLMLLVVAGILTFATLAQAQATRTWVSGVGDDVNPCSRTAPCKTFAGALSKTAASGEINALDPGGYGAVTIAKSITIDGTGTFASILCSLTTGININITDATDTPKTVRLRGLAINGAGTGIYGIRVGAANKVFVEDIVMDGMTRHGISVETGAPTQVFVKNTSIRNNTGNGINVGAGGSQVLVRDSNLENNGTGLYAERAELTVVGCVVAYNANGIVAGAGATVRLSNATVVSNETGLTNTGGGAIITFKNNLISGNRKDGEPTAPGPQR